MALTPSKFSRKFPQNKKNNYPTRGTDVIISITILITKLLDNIFPIIMCS